VRHDKLIAFTMSVITAVTTVATTLHEIMKP